MSLVIAAQDSMNSNSNSGLDENMRTATAPVGKLNIRATEWLDKAEAVTLSILNQIKAALGASSINLSRTNTWEQ